MRDSIIRESKEVTEQKNPHKKRSKMSRMSMEDSRGMKKSSSISQCGRCVQQTAIWTTLRTPCAQWRQLGTHTADRSDVTERKGCHVTLKQDPHASTIYNGTSTRLPSFSCPLLCLHEETGTGDGRGNKQQSPNLSACTCTRLSYL